MTFSCQMDDSVDLLFLYQLGDGFKVAYIQFYKTVIGFIFDILEVTQIPCIGQFVKIDDSVIGVFVDK